LTRGAIGIIAEPWCF